MVIGKLGTPREIATQGISSPDGVGIATQGFIEPILGDLILGGLATVVFNAGAIVGAGGIILGGAAGINSLSKVVGVGGLITGGAGLITISPRYVGSGGLITGGAADFETSIVPTVGGNISTGGNALVNVLFNIFPVGGLNTGGNAQENISYNFVGSGGLITDGNGNINVTFTTGDGTAGGLVTGGTGTVTSNVGPREFGRGGARIPPRRRQPTTTFEPPVWNKDDYLEPMDYLKKIQDVLDKAEKDKLELYKYISKGTIRISGHGKVIAVYRDQPDGEMIIANNPPLEPIVLDLPNVFSKGITSIEMAELEDHLFLNDLLGLGDYVIKKGPKQRFIHQQRKTTGGKAKVNFVSGAGIVKHVNMVEKLQRKEDEEFLLEVNMRTRQEQEEEELKMLGILG